MAEESAASLRQLVAELSIDVRLLALHLAGVARAESRVAVRIVTTSLLGVSIGALVALLGMMVLAAALVLGAVALGLPPWAAAVTVGLLLVAAGGGAAYTYLARLREAPIALPETRASLTETLTWLKAQTQR